jgi:hypothetical protein
LEATGPARAKYEAMITSARPYELSPGQQRFVGGTVVGENTRQTPAEASLSAYREGLKGSAKFDRMSEQARIQLQGIERRDQAIGELIDKGIADGTLPASPTGADGKPAPGYDRLQYLQQQRQSIAVSKLRLLANEGVLDGAEDARRLIDQGITPAEIQASLAQAKIIGGRYATEFVDALQPAVDRAKTTQHKRSDIEAAAKAAGDKDYRYEVNGQRGEVHSKRGPSRVQMLEGMFGDQPAPAKSPEARAAEIRAALAADDDIKSSLGGSAARALKHGRMPMGMVERRDLEAELARLTGGR